MDSNLYITLTLMQSHWLVTCYDRTMVDKKPRLIMDVMPAGVPARAAKQQKIRQFLLSVRTHIKEARKRLQPYYLYGAIVLCLIIGGILVWNTNHVTSLVPPSVSHQVHFDIYYPDPTRLPSGYSLDAQSFTANHTTVLYKIHHGDQELIVTLQQKPSTLAIQTFYHVHMPLTITVPTKVGTASLGVLNNETVVSLPTNTNTWLLMTAPLNADEAQIRRVIQAMILAS
jgi:hypothetical protein